MLAFVLRKLRRWIPLLPRGALSARERGGGKISWPRGHAGVDDREPAASISVPRPRDGAAWVKSGRIHVTDPDAGGMYAVLHVPADERIQVWMNGTPVRGEVIVDKSMELLVELQTVPPRVTYEWVVSEDRLTARLRKHVQTGMAVRLLDTAPARMLTLRLKAVPIPPDPTPLDDMMALLDAAGFSGEVDHAALAELARAVETEERVVVRGRAPRLPEPERYQRLIPEPEGHERIRVTSVAVGTPVAEVLPAVPGVPGRDVYGAEIPVPGPPKGPVLGDGVTVVQNRLVALRSGRLVFSPQRIDVHQELVIERDVTAQDGPIVFDGCVTVHGSLLDGASIRAAGDVVVLGNVLCATVLAGGGVDVAGNVVGSRLWAGYHASVYDTLLPLVREISSALLTFQRDYTILVANAAKRPDAARILPRIPAALLDGRHTLLAASLQVFVDDAQQFSELDCRYRRIADMVKNRWIGIQRSRLNAEDVEALIAAFRTYEQEVELASQAPRATLTAASAASSTLNATGDIVITGAGVFSSALESGGKVTVAGRVRGGFIHAEVAADIGVLGSEFGAECSVRVRRQDGWIRIGTRHPQTLVECGGRRDRSLVTQYQVRFSYEPAEGGCP